MYIYICVCVCVCVCERGEREREREREFWLLGLLFTKDSGNKTMQKSKYLRSTRILFFSINSFNITPPHTHTNRSIYFTLTLCFFLSFFLSFSFDLSFITHTRRKHTHTHTHTHTYIYIYIYIYLMSQTKSTSFSPFLIIMMKLPWSVLLWWFVFDQGQHHPDNPGET